MLVSPANAYLDTLILPNAQYRSIACERSFGATGRMKPLNGLNWSGNHAFHPFRTETTKLDFKYSRRSTNAGSVGEGKGCNISAVWNPHVQETLINGVMQGRKQTDLRGASALSRSRTLDFMREMYALVGTQRWKEGVTTSDYRGLKDCDALEARRQVKNRVKQEALKGWGEVFDHPRQ